MTDTNLGKAFLEYAWKRYKYTLDKYNESLKKKPHDSLAQQWGALQEASATIDWLETFLEELYGVTGHKVINEVREWMNKQ